MLAVSFRNLTFSSIVPVLPHRKPHQFCLGGTNLFNTSLPVAILTQRVSISTLRKLQQLDTEWRPLLLQSDSAHGIFRQLLLSGSETDARDETCLPQTYIKAYSSGSKKRAPTYVYYMRVKNYSHYFWNGYCIYQTHTCIDR